MTATPHRVLRARPLVEISLLLTLSTLWGASYTFIKIGVETIPPVTFMAARTLVAGLLLLAVLRVRRVDLPRTQHDWLRFLVQAGVNSVLPFTLIAWAEQSVDAGLAVILNSTTPVFAFLLTALLTRHETITAGKLLGITVALGGTCLIIGTEALHGLGEQLWPQIAIVVATVCYAFAAILGKGFKELDPMVPAAGSLLCGAAVLIPASLVLDHPWTIYPSPRSMAALAALAVFSTAIAFVIYFRLVQTLGSVATTAQAYIRVPIGVAIGVTVLGERVSPTAWLGLILVVAGVIAMTMRPGPRSP